MSPSGRFTHVIVILMFGTSNMHVLYLGRASVQRRLCPIFVKNVESSDIHEYSVGAPGLGRHIPNPTFFFNLEILGD